MNMKEAEIVEINGKKYRYEDHYGGSSVGPSYHEIVLAKHPHCGEYWDSVDSALVLCGKCKGDIFKVSSCNSNYESWAYCECGNRFVLHSG